MKFRALTGLASCLLSAALLPARLSAEEVAISRDQTYIHQGSGTQFIPTVDTFDRAQVYRYDSDNDVSARYDQRNGGAVASIYVTRVGTPDPYLWFHRVLGLISSREGFSPLIEQGVQPEFFTAPGFEKQSGIRVAYATRGGEIRSSGLAMMAYGDMLIKIRVSSSEHDRVALLGIMDRFIANFAFAQPTGYEPDPYLVEPCAGSLAFFADAKQVMPTGAMALIQATMEISPAAKAKKDAVPEPATTRFCHDAVASDQFAIYRPDNSADTYLLSYNDTGRAVVVGSGGPTLLGALSDGAFERAYSVVHQLPDQTQIFSPFDKLPLPSEVVKLPGNQRIVAATDRANKINLSSGLQ